MITINEKIEEVKKEIERLTYHSNHKTCPECGLCGTCCNFLNIESAKLQAYQEAKEIMLSEIENLNLNANPKDNCLILNKKELKEKLK